MCKKEETQELQTSKKSKTKIVLFPQTGRSSWHVITCKQVTLHSKWQILSASEEESPPSNRKEPSLWSSVQFSSLQSLSHVWLFATPWTAALQASLSITNSWSLLKLMSIELVMPSNHLILCCPLLLPSVFPSIRVFSNESVLWIRFPKYWSFSFSISPSNEYSLDWFTLGWTGWISLQSKGLSKVFSNTTVQKHQFSVVLLTVIKYWWEIHVFCFFFLVICADYG